SRGCAANDGGTRTRKWSCGGICTPPGSGTASTSARSHLCADARTSSSRGRASPCSWTAVSGTDVRSTRARRDRIRTGGPRRSKPTAAATPRRPGSSRRRDGPWSGFGSTRTRCSRASESRLSSAARLKSEIASTLPAPCERRKVVPMAKTRTYISFDFDHDDDLKTLLYRAVQERGLAVRDRRPVDQGGGYRRLEGEGTAANSSRRRRGCDLRQAHGHRDRRRRRGVDRPGGEDPVLPPRRSCQGHEQEADIREEHRQALQVDLGQPEDADQGRTLTAGDDGRLIEQYKLAAEMADRVSARRGAANGFYFTVSSALLATSESLSLATASAAGIVLACAWWLQLRSYRNLNAAKFE